MRARVRENSEEKSLNSKECEKREREKIKSDELKNLKNLNSKPKFKKARARS